MIIAVTLFFSNQSPRGTVYSVVVLNRSPPSLDQELTILHTYMEFCKVIPNALKALKDIKPDVILGRGLFPFYSMCAVFNNTKLKA